MESYCVKHQTDAASQKRIPKSIKYLHLNIHIPIDLGKSKNCTLHLQPITEERRQADPLNEEKVLNQKEQRNRSLKRNIIFLRMLRHIIM